MDLMTSFLTYVPKRPGHHAALCLLRLGMLSFSLIQIAHAAPGDTAARANSYDDAWQDGPDGWVENAKRILAGGNQVEGLVLWIGDSLTRGYGLGAWAQNGEGKTPSDQMITEWMHAGHSPQSVNSIDGFALASPYICDSRSYTVGDGRGAWDFMGTGMPLTEDPVEAQALLNNCVNYPNNINLITMLSGLPPVQFAIPEVNLLASDPSNLYDFTRMIDAMIERHVVPIIITYTYRDIPEFNILVDEYNIALTQLARDKRLPLIDLNAEMLARLPNVEDWYYTRFLADGVHYTNGGGGYTAATSPYIDGGDPATHTTGLPLTYNGYGLKGWLGVQKMKEIKALVIDGAASTAPPSPPKNLQIAPDP